MAGPRYVFVLYVCDSSPRCRDMESRFRKICDCHLHDNYSLKTVNVTNCHEIEDSDPILATPTLVRLNPGPRRQYIGELEATEEILEQLCSG